MELGFLVSDQSSVGTLGFVTLPSYGFTPGYWITDKKAGRVSVDYDRGCFDVGASYLFSHGRLSGGLLHGGSSWYHSGTVHAGLGCWLWRFRLGGRVLGRYVDREVSVNWDQSQFASAFYLVDKRSIRAIGGGGGVNLHLELWGGLGLGGELDLLGFYGTKRTKEVGGDSYSYSRGMFGADIDLHIQHQCQFSGVGLRLRLGAYGEAMDTGGYSDDLHFLGSYLSAALIF